MSCEMEILRAEVVAPGRLRISGTVTGVCSVVDVTTDKAGQGSQLISGNTPVQRPWVIELEVDSSNLSQLCDQTITVFAACYSKDQEVCSTQAQVRVICDGQSPCPTFEIVNVRYGDCDTSRYAGIRRRATFTVRVHWPAGYSEETSVKLVLWPAGDENARGEASFVATPSGSSTDRELTLHLYTTQTAGEPPVEYEGRLELATPTRCAVSRAVERFEVPACELSCPEPPATFLTVRDENGNVVNRPSNNCVNGTKATVTAASGPGTLAWRVTLNGEQASSTVDPSDPRKIEVPLPESGETVLVTARLRDGGCFTSADVSLRRCGAVAPTPCTPVPENYELKVLDDEGRVVEEGQCVRGGRAEVVAPDHEGPVAWKLDGQPTEADAALPRRLRVTLADDNEHTVEATVGRDECAMPKRRTFRRCTPPSDDDRRPGTATETSVDICLLVRLAVLVGVGIAALGAVLVGCPHFTLGMIPSEYQVTLGAALVALGAVITVVALVVLVVLAAASFCPMSWCDWLSVLWKGLALVGALFAYAAFCPGCFWFALGWLILAVSVVLFIVWVTRCGPSNCTIFNELLLLMVVFDVCQLIEAILGQCVLTGNSQLALVWGAVVVVFNAFVLWGLNRYNCVRR